MNIPNLLTLGRLLTFPIVVVLMRQGQGLAAVAVFLLGMLSDFADGWIARRFGMESKLGLYLDPVVDKILMVGLFYECSLHGTMPMTIPHLLLAREFFQSGVRTVAALSGQVVGANWMGKTKGVLETPVLAAAIIISSSAIAYEREKVTVLVVAASWVIVAIAWLFFLLFAWRNRRVLLAEGGPSQRATSRRPL